MKLGIISALKAEQLSNTELILELGYFSCPNIAPPSRSTLLTSYNSYKFADNDAFKEMHYSWC